jgi:hypothetical protein
VEVHAAVHSRGMKDVGHGSSFTVRRSLSARVSVFQISTPGGMASCRASLQLSRWICFELGSCAMRGSGYLARRCDSKSKRGK